MRRIVFLLGALLACTPGAPDVPALELDGEEIRIRAVDERGAPVAGARIDLCPDVGSYLRWKSIGPLPEPSPSKVEEPVEWDHETPPAVPAERYGITADCAGGTRVSIGSTRTGADGIARVRIPRTLRWMAILGSSGDASGLVNPDEYLAGPLRTEPLQLRLQTPGYIRIDVVTGAPTPKDPAATFLEEPEPVEFVSRGKPVAGVRIRVHERLDIRWWHASDVVLDEHEKETDSDGRVEFRARRGFDACFSVLAAGFQPRRVCAKPQETGSTEVVNLFAAVPLEGSVVDAGGRPLAGARVWAREEPVPTFSLVGRTDESGRFSLHGAMKRRKYRIYAVAPGHTQAFAIAKPGEPVALRLPRAGSIDVRVTIDPTRLFREPAGSLAFDPADFLETPPVAPDGTRAIGVVQIGRNDTFSEPSPPPGSLVPGSHWYCRLPPEFAEQDVRVDASNTASNAFEDLPAGLYMIQLTSIRANTTARIVEVRAGERTAIDLRLPDLESASIRGTVTGMPAGAFKGGSVELRTSYLAGRMVQIVGTDGSFEFPSVPHGNWLVRVFGLVDGRSWEGSTVVSLEPRQAATVAVPIKPGE